MERLVEQVIEAAWQLGHLLSAFTSDTETSLVAECIRCGGLACVDGDEACGRVLTTTCGVKIGMA